MSKKGKSKKGKSKQGKSKQGKRSSPAKEQATAQRKPKKECCLSTPRCTRCPLRMLADGTLPDGYTVRKRKLVKR